MFRCADAQPRQPPGAPSPPYLLLALATPGPSSTSTASPSSWAASRWPGGRARRRCRGRRDAGRPEPHRSPFSTRASAGAVGPASAGCALARTPLMSVARGNHGQFGISLAILLLLAAGAVARGGWALRRYGRGDAGEARPPEACDPLERRAA